MFKPLQLESIILNENTLKKNASNIEQYHLHKGSPEKLQFEVYNLKDYLRTSGVHATITTFA